MSEPAEGDGVRVARRFFELWRSGVREVDEELTDPEIELHTPLSTTQGGPYRGYDGVRQWLKEIDEQFEEWTGVAEEMIELDPHRALALGELHMRGRESGVELTQPMAWLFSTRRGRLVRYEVFAGHEEGRRAVGLSP